MSKMDKERLYRRLEALLELSKSDVNEAEALAAAMKAQELIKEYNLSLEEMDEFSKDLSQEIVEEIVKVSQVGWNRSLFSVVAKNSQCYAFVTGGRKHMKIYGHRADVDVALSIYRFLHNAAEKLYIDYKKHMTSQGYDVHKYSYMTGFISSVQEKMGSQCTALKLVVPEDVMAAVNEKYPNLGSCTPHYRHNANDYDRGVSDGRHAVNSRHLSGQKQLCG